ncbi:MAG: hypothetical protein GVY18_02330 [Bacteroidetes bacterium]|jgi:hypothetical protein|nr:hypothetical protein [Bacteroidota bacterium]
MRHLVCTALLLIGGLNVVAEGWAQAFPVYDQEVRPSGVTYRVLETPHFDLIYDATAEEAARETAGILEEDLTAAQQLVGVQRRLEIPVVLNGYSDRGSGFVTPFPFKSEIEVASIKGSRLSARFPSWLSGVAPHELIHAVHAEAESGWGLGAVVRPFAPDLVRSFNLLMPRGIVEGVAVWHESRLHPGAGRLNDPRFRMQFDAAMADEEPWSLAQLLETPHYGRPGNRMYIGGAHLYAHLAETYGEDFFRRLLDRHARSPFLGFGLALRFTSGPWPGHVEDRLHQAARQRISNREAARASSGPSETVLGTRGLTVRNPQWLTDSTLVAYAFGDHTRPGFYQIDARTGQRSPISYQRITEDYAYRLSPDRTRIVFGRYVQDPFVASQSRADLFAVDVGTGRSQRLTRHQHALAPVPRGETLWALQLDGQFTQWVRVDATGRTTPVTQAERTLFVSLHPRPSSDDVAVLLSRDGRQGLYRTHQEHSPGDSLHPWIVFRDASIYEAAWSPDGRYLLFTADLSEVTNVYALDVETGAIRQCTDVRYGALDPSVSPDGRWLAFIDYQHEAYTLARQPFDPTAGPRTDPSVVLTSTSLRAATLPDRPRADGPTTPYRARRYLMPRMVYPTLRYDRDEGQRDGLGLGLGLAAQGADPLERWTYAVEGFYQDESAWGRAVVETGRYLLRPSLSAYRLPEAARVRVADGTGTVDTLSVRQDEWGVDVGLRLPVTLEQNVFTTSAFAAVRGGWSQERLTRRDGSTLRPYRDRWTVAATAGLNYRLQANRRDLLPNTGLTLRSTALVDLQAEGQSRRRAWRSSVGWFVPVALKHPLGLRLGGGLLVQNRSSIYGLDTYLPRGYEDAFLGEGTFARLSLTSVVPLRFVDDGSVVLPVFVHVLYAYGFGERVLPLQGAMPHGHLSSVGVGLGVQLRLYYALELDLRIGVSYAVEERAWRVTFR